MLAWRLTPRDKWIARMLWEHKVLTAHQITALTFPSFRSGRMRLRELYPWGVVDRFQPFVTLGTAPMHYDVLAPAGAAVLAAEDGLDIKQLGYRHDRVFDVAHSLRLAHTPSASTSGSPSWSTAPAPATPGLSKIRGLAKTSPGTSPRHEVVAVSVHSEGRAGRPAGDLRVGERGRCPVRGLSVFGRPSTSSICS
ncbi:replication-relaxation family protein [Nocardia sp. NRRL S-836]|uniref:replication-relaxation family protein n=1 Tax=Nocardia sp. NRRL S-836 TaxID=1519492 RepID=UPI0018D1DF72|nr:replication-relaxation family protein [Nocardia sp. NRRL S-836]